MKAQKALFVQTSGGCRPALDDENRQGIVRMLIERCGQGGLWPRFGSRRQQGWGNAPPKRRKHNHADL